jgi:hypothetical protein
MDYQLTAIYHKVQEGYAAFVEELPGANSARKICGNLDIDEP